MYISVPCSQTECDVSLRRCWLTIKAGSFYLLDWPMVKEGSSMLAPGAEKVGQHDHKMQTVPYNTSCSITKKSI